jgi:parallel beta-helix repeat protein
MFNQLSSPKIEDCTFSTNSAQQGGGGIYNYNSSSPTVTNCIFHGNSAQVDGGGMRNTASSPDVTNCVFTGNTAQEGGGGMFNWYNSTPEVTNCTFRGNSTPADGGGMLNAQSSPIVTNCIFWSNIAAGSEQEISSDAASSPTVSFCNVQGGCYMSSGCTTDEAGNMDSVPLFVSATDLRLQTTSPCVDTGSNSAVPASADTDLDGNPRIVDGNGDNATIVDMGAYEYQP